MTFSLFQARRALAAAGAATAVCIAGIAQAQSPQSDFHVKETFNVGDAVYVRALTVDRKAGSVWVGTSAGVHEIDLGKQLPRNTFTRSEGLANEYVFAVGIDSQDYKWFGTNAGGVSRYKDSTWKTYFPMHGLADYWIYSFANDKDGNLWIGTWAGVNHFNLKTGEFKTYVKELINEWVYGIDVDAKGRTWFATEGGVSMFDGKQWQSWTHKDGLGGPNVNQLPASSNTGLGTRSRHDLSTMERGDPTYNPNYTFAIHVDPGGTIWAGTWGGGVSRFDGKNWSNFTSNDGLVGNIVYAIARDPGGALWFGTDKGLSRFDGKTWRSFTTKEGLLDAHVYAIAAAPNGDIWVGTRRGVAIIGKK
jgi:ligand-binding sensor domain-containing protein